MKRKDITKAAAWKAAYWLALHEDGDKRVQDLGYAADFSIRATGDELRTKHLNILAQRTDAEKLIEAARTSIKLETARRNVLEKSQLGEFHTACQALLGCSDTDLKEVLQSYKKDPQFKDPEMDKAWRELLQAINDKNTEGIFYALSLILGYTITDIKWTEFPPIPDTLEL